MAFKYPRLSVFSPLFLLPVSLSRLGWLVASGRKFSTHEEDWLAVSLNIVYQT